MIDDSPYSIRTVSWQEATPQFSSVRRAVFIEEQLVPEELEWAGEDAAAIHVLARDSEGTPIGAGRLLFHDGRGHIGRIAVIKPWRARGVGSAILQAPLDAARERGCAGLVLNTQTYAMPFYERFGFVREGSEFLDAEIPHYRMTRQSPHGQA